MSPQVFRVSVRAWALFVARRKLKEGYGRELIVPGESDYRTSGFLASFPAPQRSKFPFFWPRQSESREENVAPLGYWIVILALLKDRI